MTTLTAVLFGPWIFLSVLSSCLAQTPVATPGHSKSEWELSDAPIKPLVERRILASLIDAHKDEYDEDKRDEVKAIALRSTVKFVRLDGRGRIGIEVKSASPWCGATGNCEVRIFDSRIGSLLMADDGWDYGFRRRMHHGMYDFYMRANLSYCSGTLHEYQFDGKVYKQVQEVQEQKGCQ